MIKKEKYEEPAMEVISLASIQETMQSASASGTGANISWQGDEQSFDSFFGS